MSWVVKVVDEVLARSTEDVYTCAAGISPSGIVHFGNFREIVTSEAVRAELVRRGHRARLLFSWDNYDRMRKVPAGVPASFAEHIGKPLSAVPDPNGEYASYAERFQKPFEQALHTLGYTVEFRYQTDMYASGAYDPAIIHAMQCRKEIGSILLAAMTDKAKSEKGIVDEEYLQSYYPISVYSRFTGKDFTEVVAYDGQSTITYKCKESGKEETIDFTKDRCVKLAWKVDWPMRWAHERVSFEPGGHDHASPGSSYDVGKVLAPRVFNYNAPTFVEYKFVGIRGLGAKMSGSKGNAVSPSQLLEIYEPEVLLWMYNRKDPDQSFELAFDTEIYRQYDEYDALHAPGALSFRSTVAYGQIVQWDFAKLCTVLDAAGISYVADQVARRLVHAKSWLETYNQSERIVVRDTPNVEYWATMSDDFKAMVSKLASELATGKYTSVDELTELVYAIPKSGQSESQLKKDQRAFFEVAYQLLIGADTGPRLGTFIWAIGIDTTARLLRFQ